MRLNYYELDEEFGNKMNLLFDKPQYFIYKSGRLFLDNFLGRLYICYLCQFCQIDAYGGRQIESKSTKWAYKEHFNPKYSSKNKNRWWPPVAFVLFWYSCIRLTVNMYFQYIYDYHLLRYERYKANVGARPSATHSSVTLPSLSLPLRPATTSLSSPQSSTPSSSIVLSPLLTASSHQKDATLQTHGAYEIIAQHSPAQNYQYPTISKNLTSQLIAQTGVTILENLRLKTTANQHEHEQQLLRNVQSAKVTLKSIGAPYIELNFVIEMIYYILVTASFTVLYIMKFYYDRINVFDYSVIRSILDLKTELRVCNRLIRCEINKFIISSRNFTEACIEQSKQFTKEHLFYRHKFEQIYARAELQRFLLDHTLTIRQLEQMALNGVLLPCNRTPEWIGTITHYACLWNLIILGYGFLVVIFFAFFFFFFYGIDIQFSLLDILTIIEAGILVAFILICGIFYLSLSVISTVDQIYFVRDICNRIRKCIRDNHKIFYDSLHLSANKHHCYNGQQQQGAILDSDKSDQSNDKLSLYTLATTIKRHKKRMGPNDADYDISGVDSISSNYEQILPINNKQVNTKLPLQVEWNYTQMNANLLEILMLYKIFVAQAKPITKAVGAFGFAMVVLIFTIPINTRIHVPYFDKNLKLYAMLFGVLMVSIVDLCLIPICYMYSKCINIYRCLSSLMAHTIEITNHPMAGRIYDTHTIWLLRKELNHPERLTNQFAIHTLGINFTFVNVLKVHFWVGLISLSIIIDTNSNQLEFFGSLFNDPLGIFD